jgi:hypothetical protein
MPAALGLGFPAMERISGRQRKAPAEKMQGEYVNQIKASLRVSRIDQLLDLPPHGPHGLPDCRTSGFPAYCEAWIR